jgi:hypothetical protein
MTRPTPPQHWMDDSSMTDLMDEKMYVCLWLPCLAIHTTQLLIRLLLDDFSFCYRLSSEYLIHDLTDVNSSNILVSSILVG